MTQRPHGAPELRALTFRDLKDSLALGIRDFLAGPMLDLFFASFYVLAGLIMGWITYRTGQTFWLVLAVLGFPIVGTLAALGFYETSRLREAGEPVEFGAVVAHVWEQRSGQLPWLGVIIIVVFLFWFFLGHMIFALFLGLSPMTNISSSLDVFFTQEGLMMLVFGTAVGAVFSLLVFGVSVLGMPMLMDRDVDFMTASIRSMSAVKASPVLFLIWGVFVAVVVLAAMVPLFLGLFIAMPVLGHASWHLYKRATV